LAAAREQARSLERRGDLAGAMKMLKPYVENGKANSGDINQYGWYAVMAGDVQPDVIQVVQQTTQQTANRNYGILHTLACMYAETGQVKQAQQVLLEALKLTRSIDPPDTIWYGYARLAESYGENEAAANLYRKVERPEFYEGDPGATYTLAQNRLVSLGRKAGVAAGK
jgi:tetratricopeptide (TPR) repeat protein